MQISACVTVVRILARISDQRDPTVQKRRGRELCGLTAPACRGVTRRFVSEVSMPSTRTRRRPRASSRTSTVSPSTTRSTVAVAGAASTGAAQAEAGAAATAAANVSAVAKCVLMYPFSCSHRKPPARISTRRHGPASSAINASTRAALAGSIGLPVSADSTSSAESPPTAAASPALKFARRRAA